MQRQQQQRKNWLAIFAVILTIFMLVIGFLSLFKIPGGSGSSFDSGKYAYSLAQQAQDYRRTSPSGRNYCVVALYLEDTRGTIKAGQRKLFFGFGKQSNTNHCEQLALDWVAKTGLPNVFGLTQLSTLNAIHIVLFTQVRACAPCIKSFADWHQQLQQQTAAQPGGASVQVHLDVWEITFGSPSGFDPGMYKAGPFTPGPPKPKTHKPASVRPQDLNQVYP